MTILYLFSSIHRAQTAFLASLLLLGLLSSRPAFAQAPANDDPCGAVVLTPSGQLCTTPTVGNTQGATLTTPNGYANLTSCGTGFGQPRDVWYRFTTTGSGLGSTGATLTVAGNAAGQLRLFSAASCTGPFTELGCQAASASNTAAPALSTTTLTANTTYYVRVAGNGSTAAGPFTICLTDGPGQSMCAQPTIGLPTYTNADNTAATIPFQVRPEHVAPYTVRISQYVGVPTVVLQTYQTSSTAPIGLTGLLVGQRYRVEVQVFCQTGGQSTARVDFVVPPPNDEPCRAVPLLVGAGGTCTPTTGTVGGATPTAPNGYGPGCGTAALLLGQGQGNDVWYTFQTAPSGPGSTGTVLTVNGSSAAGELRLFAAATCAGPFAEVGCTALQVGQSGPLALAATNLLPNTRYYASVQLLTPQYLNVNFTICATELSPALACPALSQIGVPPLFIRPTSATVGVELVPNTRPPLTFTVTYAPTAGGALTTLTLPAATGPNAPQFFSAVLTGLTPGTTYTVTVTANCAGGTQSPPLTTTFTTSSGPIITPGPPPVNDNCAAATVLSVNNTCVPTTGTTVDATPTTGLPAADCASAATPNDVWYQMTVPASGTVTVRVDSVTGSALRHVQAAFYTGPCGSLRQIECAQGYGLADLTTRAAGVPGTVLYLRVWAEATGLLVVPQNGPFTICALMAPLPCPLVTNVVVSGLTTTAATVSFTPGAGNDQFTVRAVPVGGGPVVEVGGASSPIQLTGLLPGTAYTISVASSCGGTDPGPGVRTTLTTLTPPVICPAPVGLYAGTVTGTTASVSFQPVPGALGYTFTYTAAGGTPQTLPVTTSPFSLTGLTPNTLYTLSLQATCPVGPSVAATAAFTTTNGCAAPLFATVTAVGSTSATIGFALPTGSSGFTAVVSVNGGAAQPLSPAPTTAPFTLNGLVPGTSYAVTLASQCPGSLLSTSETVRFVTLLPVASCAAPTAVVATPTGATTATVRFGATTGAVTYTATATPSSGAVIAVSGAASPLALTGLLPGTAYTVTVVTNCGAGLGSTATPAVGFATPLAARNAALAATVGLFPNPAHHSVTLTVPAALLRQASLLTISDVLGRTVRQRHVTPSTGIAADTRAELDLTGLPTGVYLLRLFSNAGPITKRLVIE